ncbi:protein phosphatase 1 regulatory subunit 27-like, partial [Alosa alosa]|uniref:protein phosphatase 1 regulatory subunit 27-like n=1 Tax=Alosa alosa TaxID=278164 RepID=UPI00201527BD
PPGIARDQADLRRASSTRATEARQTSARRTSIKSTAAPTSVAADDNATATTGADPDATATDPDASPQVVVKPVRNVRFPNDIIFQDFVRHGDLEQIGRFMRARKVRLDKFFLSGMAALHEAVLSGNLECVKLLVFYGADVHQRDEDGWTPLHMACSDSFPEIAKYLISKGAGTEAANANGDRPADLIDPECKELVEMFKVGCV